MADLFPTSFWDSELGEIPQGWRVSAIGEQATAILGGTPARAEPAFWGGTIPWINSGKANDFRVMEPTEYITELGMASSATKLLPRRTTIIAITGATLGQVSMTEIATCANQSVVGVLGSATMPSEYLYCWVKQNIGRLIARQTGGAQQHINKNDVCDLPLLLPPRPLLDAFHNAASPLFDRIANALTEASSIASLLDALLPRLLSGTLSLRDARSPS
ncbi:MAG: restriction endonuclease subunit S [Gemmatimonadetes bacterium]|nr:restriction endonuclease subunit S [Gemmatimonadota bacterium]